jgi:hypothetical protein
MDNYYTSPQVAVALAERNVYIRGTCRRNRAGFPAAVQYSQTEAAKVERGTHKMVSDAKYGIACYGWCDGCPVHFLTSADGTSTNEVTRRIGRCDKKVKAPICIKRYNHGMQAVDRHDQMRQTFSLASRHGFKKYYVKIILGLMDMALVNAYIHYQLVNPEDCKKDTARYDFMDSLADALIMTDWDNFANSESGMSNDSIFEAILQQGQPFQKGQLTRTKKPKGQAVAQDLETYNQGCVPYAVSQFMSDRNQKNGFSCQVCKFEERGNRLGSVAICTKHCLRLCTKSYERERIFKMVGSEIEEITDYSWMAPNTAMSCWEKAHSFYIPKGLFVAGTSHHVNQEWSSSNNKLKFVHAAVSSECYVTKRKAFGLPPVKRGGSKKDKVSV